MLDMADSSVEVGAGTLLGFETAEREVVVVRDNGAGCIISVGRGEVHRSDYKRYE
jgi:hypothetical protein